jgi:hypothetical protein
MIDIIREALNDDCDNRHPKPVTFPTTKTWSKRFEPKLGMSVVRQQQYLEIIRHRALGLFTEHEQRSVAD